MKRALAVWLTCLAVAATSGCSPRESEVPSESSERLAQSPGTTLRLEALGITGGHGDAVMLADGTWMLRCEQTELPFDWSAPFAMEHGPRPINVHYALTISSDLEMTVTSGEVKCDLPGMLRPGHPEQGAEPGAILEFEVLLVGPDSEEESGPAGTALFRSRVIRVHEQGNAPGVGPIPTTPGASLVLVRPGEVFEPYPWVCTLVDLPAAFRGRWILDEAHVDITTDWRAYSICRGYYYPAIAEPAEEP